MIKYLQQNSRTIRTVLVVLIVIYAMFLRIQYRAEEGWRADEHPTQLAVMGKPMHGMIKTTLKTLQFPGDSLLVRPFYKIFGANKWGLAIPHILITLLGFYLLYRACAQYFKTFWGYIIAFGATACNATLIAHAFRIRPYSVLVTLSIASFLVMKYVVEENAPTLSQKFWVCLFIFLTLLFHPFGAFILFFPYVFHLMCSRKRNFGEVFLENIKHYGIGVLVPLPLWLYFHFGFDKTYLGSVNTGTFSFVDKGVLPVIKSIFGNLIGSRKLYFLLIGFILAFIVPHKERFKQVIFFGVLVVVPVGMIFLSCLYYKLWFIQRLFIWVMPSFVFLLAWQWDSLIDHFIKKACK